MSTLKNRKKPSDIVKIWDGKGFDYVSRTEANRRVKENTAQITENLQAHELKYPTEFSKPKSKDKEAKPAESGKGYKTKVVSPE